MADAGSEVLEEFRITRRFDVHDRSRASIHTVLRKGASLKKWGQIVCGHSRSQGHSSDFGSAFQQCVDGHPDQFVLFGARFDPAPIVDGAIHAFGFRTVSEE